MGAGRLATLEQVAGLIVKVASENKCQDALEVGVHWAYSTRALLKGCTHHVTSIDNHFYPYAVTRVEEDDASDRWTYIVEDSLTAMPKEKDEIYDLVFIDGAHDYDHVYSDLTNALRILKPGGVLLVDDYLHEKGGDVRKATDEIVSQHNLSMKIHPAIHEPTQMFGVAELSK